MKLIDSSRSDLLARPGLAVANLVKLTTYTNKAAGLVGTVYYFAERWTLYGGQQWLPSIRGFEFQRDAMPHLPDAETDGSQLSGLLTQLRVNLRNTVNPSTGFYLIRELSLAGLDGAAVEWCELPINLQGGETFVDLSALNGDEHVVRFRGDLLNVVAVDEAEIVLRFETPEPQIPWEVLSDAANVDPLDLGKRKNIVYGAAKRVPLYGEIVGSLTTLAASATIAATSLVLTDATGFPSSGSAMIGTEKVTWTGKSTNTLTTVTRGASSTPAGEHSAGSIILELVTLARFSVAAHACKAIQAVYALSPFTGELHRITTAFTSTAHAGRIEFSSAQLEALLDDLATAGATVTQQPAVSTQPVVSHPVLGNVSFQQQVSGPTNTGPNDLDNPPGLYGFNSPGLGSPTITSQVFSFVASGTGVLQVYGVVPMGTPGGASFSTPFGTLFLQFMATVSPANQNVFSGATYTVQANVNANSIYVTRSSGNCLLGSASRTDIQFTQASPSLSASAAIAGSDATQVKVRGESVGFGLRLFADVDGYAVPITSWTTLLALDSDAGNWSAPGSFALLANEASIKIEGSGSLRVTTAFAGSQAAARRAFAAPLNLTDGRHIVVTVRVENAAQLAAATGVSVLLSSSSGFTSYSEYAFGTADGLAADGNFHELEIDPASADSVVGGGVTLASVTHIQLQILNLAGAAASHFYFDDIRVSDLGAASPDYLAVQGGLIEKAPDILRHLIGEVVGLTNDALDDEWNEAGDSTHLNDNVHAAVLNFMGDSFSAVAGRIAFESRASLILEERLAGSMYRMLVADSGYRWPAPVQTITEWASIIEQSAERRERFSRFRGLYAWDPSKGNEGDAFAGLVRIDPDQNDVSDPATPELVDTEARIGRHDAPPVSFFSIQDQATAREVLGYYAVELSRSPLRAFQIAGVPWTQAYLLERGDVVRFAPPWEGGTVSARVIDVQRDPFRQLYDLATVEVPTQEIVQMHVGLSAALIATAEPFVGGDVFVATALTAALIATAAATDNSVKLECALTETVIPTAQLALIGGVPLACALTATLAVTAAPLAQLGPIEMQAAPTATLTSNAHLFQSMRCALTATLIPTAKAEELNRFLGGLVPVEDGYPYSDAQRALVNLNGTDEYLSNQTNQLLGIANAWTISFSFQPLVGVASGDLLQLIQAAGNANQIRIYQDSGALRVATWDSAGTALKDYSFAGLTTSISSAVLVWNGTTLTGRLNGVAVTPTQNTNNSGSMTDTARHIVAGYGGAYFTGRLHSIAIWSEALSANGWVEMWNQGILSTRDLTRNLYAYTQAAALQHWWRFAHNVSDIGKDYGRGTAIDLMTDAANISTADIEALACPDGAAVELDGSTEYLANTSFAALGLADVWTVDAWVLVSGDGSGAGGEGVVFACDSDDGGKNRILIQFEGSTAGIPNRWIGQVSDGTPSFQAVASGVTDADIGLWQYVALTKNGGTIKLYINGVLRGTTAASVPTQTDVARQVAIGVSQLTSRGQKFNGRILCVRAWDVDLGASAIRSLWCSGMKDVDPRREFGSYTQNESLKHWWHVGPLGAVGVGGDFWVDHVASGGVNLETNAANVATADTSLLRGSNGAGACLEFNGTNEQLANTTNQAIGIANAWTLEAWAYFDAPTAAAIHRVVDIYNGTTNVSRIQFLQRGDQPNDPFQVVIASSAPANIKNYLYDGIIPTATWVHLALTWDGTTLTLYKDAVAQTPSTLTTDTTGTMADDNRGAYIGATVASQFIDGRIARVSLWNVALSATAILQIKARRLNADLRTAFGAYSSQAALKHQWIVGGRYASTTGTLAVDLVASGGIDITANQAGLDETNLHSVSF